MWNLLHETNGKYENLNSMKSHLHYYHTIYYPCSYVVNSVHEYFVVTDSHLQISQHQASLKHEKFTESHHSYTTLPTQNILQLQLHFSFTLYSINNEVHKIRVNWNGGLPLHVPKFKMFLGLPKFECGCFNWLKFDLDSCNLPKYLQYISYANLKETLQICLHGSNCTQVWMKLFQLPKYDWSCCNPPKYL